MAITQIFGLLVADTAAEVIAGAVPEETIVWAIDTKQLIVIEGGIAHAAFSVSSAAALTKVDDTNVTLTLGGTPATSLLQAVSLTLGWTGQLSSARGGLGIDTSASTGFLEATAGTWAVKTASQMRTDLGLAIGSDVQAYDATLAALAGLTITANSLIYGTGTDTFSVLAQNTTATRKFLREVSSTAPVWDTLQAGDIPDLVVSYGSYRTILQAGCSVAASITAGTFVMATQENIGTKSGATSTAPARMIYIDSANFPTINGVAARLRVRAVLQTNATAPTGNWTVGLYPVSSTGGGAGVISCTVGTVVSGSNGGTVSAPAATSQNNLVGSDFTLPANGYYVLGLVTDATTAASSYTSVSALLEWHN